MTIEIFKNQADAENRADKMDVLFGTVRPVIKVKVDKTQESFYGFRYFGDNQSVIRKLDVGYIILADDWTSEEASECGLVEIRRIT